MLGEIMTKYEQSCRLKMHQYISRYYIQYQFIHFPVV